MSKVLIVDDESRIRKLVADFLKREGYETIEASNGIEALQKLENEEVAIVILDVMMPYMDGWEVLKVLRRKYRTPVMMLTAKSEEYDQLNGFDLGTDDYVTKPFSPTILVARVKALLARTNEGGLKELDRNLETEEVDKISCMIEDKVMELKCDKKARKVYVEDEEIHMTFREYELLIYLIENPNIALSREQILSAVWEIDYFGELRTVDTHIKQLRAKLGEIGRFIVTVRGVGYRFEI